MKSKLFLFLIIGITMMTTACKSEFEKLRATADAETLYARAFQYYEEEEFLKAQTLFELIINNLRGKVEAEKVYFYYAYTHYHLGRYVLGSYYFKNFSSTFPNSDYREEADFMVAYSHFQLSPSYRLDQTYTQKAVEAFQLFVNSYPTSTRVEEANQLIDMMRDKQERKAYAEGQLYFDLRQYQSATASFENMLKDFPDSEESEKIRYMIAKASYSLAANSIYEKREDRYNETIKKADTFINKYPSSKFVKEIRSIKKNSSKKIKELI